MSKNTQKTVDNEKRTDTIVGIITVLAVLALIVWFFVSVSVRGNAISEIAYGNETRRGQEQIFTANVKSSKIKNGASVKWIVDGEVVSEGTYVKGEPLTLTYAPKTSGQSFVTVQVGKYNRSAYVETLPPVLTVTAPNIVITYGEQLPDCGYECSGFVDEDCADMLDYGGAYFVCDDNDVQLPCATREPTALPNRLNVGVYKINMEQNCCFKDYEVNYVGGTLTVLPAELSVNGNFVKTYDQCNTIDNPQITLCGVKEGDEVYAQCDKLYFDNKNVGLNKQIMLANVELAGADCGNYVLTGEAQGTILPKSVEIKGLVIRDKMYDGTTRAQIDKMGYLDGVIEGDSVAIGSIELSFAEANAGEQQINLDKVTLIGADKDNYVVSGVDVESANINATLWDRIFVKNPAITAQG